MFAGIVGVKQTWFAFESNLDTLKTEKHRANSSENLQSRLMFYRQRQLDTQIHLIRISKLACKLKSL